MNRVDAAKLLPIIQAFGEGKTIQFKSPTYDRWDDVTPNTNCAFIYPPHRYRIKPEPEVVYVNKLKKEYENKGFAHATKERAILLASGIEHQYEYIAKKFVEAE